MRSAERREEVVERDLVLAGSARPRESQAETARSQRRGGCLRPQRSNSVRGAPVPGFCRRRRCRGRNADAGDCQSRIAARTDGVGWGAVARRSESPSAPAVSGQRKGIGRSGRCPARPDRCCSARCTESSPRRTAKRISPEIDSALGGLLELLAMIDAKDRARRNAVEDQTAHLRPEEARADMTHHAEERRDRESRSGLRRNARPSIFDLRHATLKVIGVLNNVSKSNAVCVNFQ